MSLFLVVLASTAHAKEQRLNVLFLLADDMRADSIAALGNPAIRTPHLDALVQRGFVFRNAYCLGGNSPAVCTPSRNMLLSGQAYFRWKDFTPPGGRRGVLAPGDGPNFPLSMKAAGYETYHHGKRGNTAPLIQARFEINKTLPDDEAERRSGEPGKVIVDDALAFLDGRQSDRPFFMYLAFGNPHDPRVAAPKYLDQYDRNTLPLPKNFLPQHPFNNGEMEIRDEQLLPWPRTESEIRRTIHEYNATVTALDFHIGRLLQSLEARGLSDQTLIIFSADQGISIGSHGLLGKQNLYDAAMKSPLVFAGPGIPHGQSDSLAYLLDIYPTVCDLVGAERPRSIDGRSLKPVLEGRANRHREQLFLSYRDVQRAVRTDRWKLIRYPQVNVTQLFDMQFDPDEMQNLAARPEHAPRVAELMNLLQQQQVALGDDLPLTVANPRPAEWSPPRAAVPDKLVVLTFDDSVKSHYTVARPILRHHGFGATFFITEGFTFRKNKRDYLTWEEIKALHDEGFEIGNHTVSHVSITPRSLERLDQELEGINARCREYGIPSPTSFAWPGNALTVEALPILRKHGFRFARRGGEPEQEYGPGRGYAYEPGRDHPLLIPSGGDGRPHWTLTDFHEAVSKARDGKIVVLQFHGVPEGEHSWVDTPRERFEEFMQYLKDQQYTVIAVRDLAKYVDPAQTPSDPLEIVRVRTGGANR